MTKKRKSPSENHEILLFEEVGGNCPLCAKSLMQKKSKNQVKVFEVAHIYPLNPTKEEFALLKDVEKLSDDPNDSKNLIALSLDCHERYDKKKTLEEYNKLVEIKKGLVAKTSGKNIWGEYKLEEEVQEIIKSLSSIENKDDTTLLNLDPAVVDKKVTSELLPITKRKIKAHVSDCFISVRRALTELEKECPNAGMLIAAQIRAFYVALKAKGQTQQEIFTGLVDWVCTKTQHVSKDACEVFVSFFVQNCEVFDDNTK